MKKIIYILAMIAAWPGNVAPVLAQESGQFDIRAIVPRAAEDIIHAIGGSISGQYLPVEFGRPPMIINGGAAKTNRREANVMFNVSGAFWMQISDKNDFAGADWEVFSKFKLWALSWGDGQKTVWARFKNLSGVVSKTVNANIFLDTTPPANVVEFIATGADTTIALAWKNPPDEDFAKVRIVRNKDFYPVDLQDGDAVYDGRGESFADSGREIGKTYYYAAFAYDDLGNVSSGALAAAAAGEKKTMIEIPLAPMTLPRIEEIGINNFEFIQNGKRIVPRGGKILIDRFSPFRVSLPYDAAPEVLKTIMATISQNGKSFSFLLRINRDNTAYEAILTPPDTGDYDFHIMILDYKNQALKKIAAGLEVFKADIHAGQTKITEYKIIKSPPLIIYLILFLVAVFTARKIYRLARKKRQKIQVEP